MIAMPEPRFSSTTSSHSVFSERADQLREEKRKEGKDSQKKEGGEAFRDRVLDLSGDSTSMNTTSGKNVGKKKKGKENNLQEKKGEGEKKAPRITYSRGYSPLDDLEHFLVTKGKERERGVQRVGSAMI